MEGVFEEGMRGELCVDVGWGGMRYQLRGVIVGEGAEAE